MHAGDTTELGEVHLDRHLPGHRPARSRSRAATADLTGFAEDSLPAALADSSDGRAGCDQLAVIITENRKPGVGSLARTADLVSTRPFASHASAAGPAVDAPAMLLPEADRMPDGRGRLHGRQLVDQGLRRRSRRTAPQPAGHHPLRRRRRPACGTSGLLRQGARRHHRLRRPKVGAPTTPDPPSRARSRPSRALWASPSVDSAEQRLRQLVALRQRRPRRRPADGPLVSRSIVDDRYLAGVKSAMSGAQSSVFSSLSAT